ncbi:hypothetical protein Y032_0029g1888 [Ancylostoma ceylanicum]|uniref:Uncharacterized protein n=1 Tax=Ancylostoma ceylanicum TaxID=53326 RepID=A0A016URH8_9BILA|nr:hypothetical protein Y032_0029g1888 [Ancylostoma ceylanicum]
MNRQEEEEIGFRTSTKYVVETPLHIPKHYSKVHDPKIRHRFCNNLILLKTSKKLGPQLARSSDIRVRLQPCL